MPHSAKLTNCCNRYISIIGILLRDLTLVDLCLLGKEVDRVGFLQQGIASVLLIAEDTSNRGNAPIGFSSRRKHIVLGELLRNSVVGHSLQEKLVYAPDGNSLLLVDDQIAVLALVITKEPFISDRDLAVSESLSLSPGAVLGNAPAFLLSK